MSHDYDNIEVIGFDLGHGETALAKVRLHNEAEPVMLSIHNRKSQITAIAHHTSKGTIIGEMAFVQPGVTDFEICFKKRPTDDLKGQEPIQEFVQEVYKVLRDQRQISAEDKHHFFVGCPSGWEDKEKDIYQQIMSKAGLPNVTVVAESRAALMHGKESGKFTMGQLAQSVLVIDIGSSTTDYTLILSMSDKPLDTGYDLGAALIDKAILAETLATHRNGAQLEELFEAQPRYRNRCELKCRRAKEEYFSNPDFYQEPDSFVPVLSERIQQRYVFEPLVNGPIMQKVINQPLQELGGKSWVDSFREQLKEVKNKLDEKNIEPSAVLFTGGASKMGFIPQIYAEVFTDLPYKPDGEPEFCIARGLARWGRVYIRTSRFMDEVNQFLDRELTGIVKSHIPELIKSLAEVLADSLVDQVLKPHLKAWRNGHITTLKNLETDITEAAKAWLEGDAAKKKITMTVIKWLEVVQKRVEEESNPICSKYGLPPGTLGDKIVDLHPDTSHFSWTISLDELQELIQSEFTSSFLEDVLTYFAMFILVLLGPIGIIIATVIAVWKFFGGNEQNVKDTNVPQAIRHQISDQNIQQLGQKQKPELQRKLQEMFSQDATLINKLVQPTHKWLKKAVKEKADRARLLIK